MLNKLAINFYSYDKKEICSVRLSNNSYITHINLLMIPSKVYEEDEMQTDEKQVKPIHNFVLISNLLNDFNKLFKNSDNKTYLCDIRLIPFNTTKYKPTYI